MDKTINGVCTPFKDLVVTNMPSTLDMKPTMDMPNQPGNSAQSMVTQKVTPINLPENNLFIKG